MSLIFIAIPTTGTVRNSKLTPQFLKMLASLHTKYPQHTFIAPMVQDYQILKYMDVTATWEDWGKHCRALIERCDEVWVLKFEGWDSSVGVAGEIECGVYHGKPIAFLEVDDEVVVAKRKSEFYNRKTLGCSFDDDESPGFYRVYTASGRFVCVTDWEGAVTVCELLQYGE
jgi:hypothetical protein